MIRPHPNQTDADLHNRAAALRAARHCCQSCGKPKTHPLAVEVYQDDAGAIVLCLFCARIYPTIVALRKRYSRWQGWR
jgi:hypothetical protein